MIFKHPPFFFTSPWPSSWSWWSSYLGLWSSRRKETDPSFEAWICWPKNCSPFERDWWKQYGGRNKNTKQKSTPSSSKRVTPTKTKFVRTNLIFSLTRTFSFRKKTHHKWRCIHPVFLRTSKDSRRYVAPPEALPWRKPPPAPPVHAQSTYEGWYGTFGNNLEDEPKALWGLFYQVLLHPCQPQGLLG